MKKKKEKDIPDDAVFEITPLGLLGAEVCDRIILTMFRLGYNCMVIEPTTKRLEFTEVELANE